MEVHIGSLVSIIFNRVGLLVLLGLLGLYVCGLAFSRRNRRRPDRAPFASLFPSQTLEQAMQIILEAEQALPLLNDTFLHAAREVLDAAEAAQAIVDAGETPGSALHTAATTILGAQQAAKDAIKAFTHKEAISAAAAQVRAYLAEEHPHNEH